MGQVELLEVLQIQWSLRAGQEELPNIVIVSIPYLRQSTSERIFSFRYRSSNTMSLCCVHLDLLYSSSNSLRACAAFVSACCTALWTLACSSGIGSKGSRELCLLFLCSCVSQLFIWFILETYEKESSEELIWLNLVKRSLVQVFFTWVIAQLLFKTLELQLSLALKYLQSFAVPSNDYKHVANSDLLNRVPTE